MKGWGGGGVECTIKFREVPALSIISTFLQATEMELNSDNSSAGPHPKIPITLDGSGIQSFVTQFVVRIVISANKPFSAEES